MADSFGKGVSENREARSPKRSKRNKKQNSGKKRRKVVASGSSTLHDTEIHYEGDKSDDDGKDAEFSGLDEQSDCSTTRKRKNLKWELEDEIQKELEYDLPEDALLAFFKLTDSRHDPLLIRSGAKKMLKCWPLDVMEEYGYLLVSNGNSMGEDQQSECDSDNFVEDAILDETQSGNQVIEKDENSSITVETRDNAFIVCNSDNSQSRRQLINPKDLEKYTDADYQQSLNAIEDCMKIQLNRLIINTHKYNSFAKRQTDPNGISSKRHSVPEITHSNQSAPIDHDRSYLEPYNNYIIDEKYLNEIRDYVFLPKIDQLVRVIGEPRSKGNSDNTTLGTSEHIFELAEKCGISNTLINNAKERLKNWNHEYVESAERMATERGAKGKNKKKPPKKRGKQGKPGNSKKLKEVTIEQASSTQNNSDEQK